MMINQSNLYIEIIGRRFYASFFLCIILLSFSTLSYAQEEAPPLTDREILDLTVKAERAKYTSIDSVNQLINKLKSEKKSAERKEEGSDKAVRKLERKLESIKKEMEEIKAESNKQAFSGTDALRGHENAVASLKSDYESLKMKRIGLENQISNDRRSKERLNIMVDSLNNEVLGLESVENLKIEVSPNGNVLLRSSQGKYRFNLHSINLENLQPYEYVHKRFIRCDVKTNYWAFDLACPESNDQKSCVLDKDKKYIEKLEGVKFFTKAGAQRCITFLQRLKTKTQNRT